MLLVILACILIASIMVARPLFQTNPVLSNVLSKGRSRQQTFGHTLREPFMGGACVGCSCRWGDECASCSNCGTCLKPDGQLRCVQGDSRGPFMDADCSAWWFDKRPLTMNPRVNKDPHPGWKTSIVLHRDH